MGDKTSRLGIRLEPDLLAKLDELAKQYQRENPGVRFTRSDVARLLLQQALTEKPPRRQKP